VFGLRTGDGEPRPFDLQATRIGPHPTVTQPDIFVLLALLGGAVLLVAVNVALQRLARPDRGTDRIAGCCGMAVPSDISTPLEHVT